MIKILKEIQAILFLETNILVSCQSIIYKSLINLFLDYWKS